MTVWFVNLICHGRNRVEAIQRMNRSLDEFVIEGITTTIPYIKNFLIIKNLLIQILM